MLDIALALGPYSVGSDAQVADPEASIRRAPGLGLFPFTILALLAGADPGPLERSSLQVGNDTGNYIFRKEGYVERAVLVLHHIGKSDKGLMPAMVHRDPVFSPIDPTEDRQPFTVRGSHVIFFSLTAAASARTTTPIPAPLFFGFPLFFRIEAGDNPHTGHLLPSGVGHQHQQASARDKGQRQIIRMLAGLEVEGIAAKILIG